MAQVIELATGLLEAKQLCYAREGQQWHYDFSLPAGKRMLITGVSGAGKSTLLDLLVGFVPASSGQLNFAGQNLAPLAVHQRPFSLLSQSDNVFLHLSVAQNLALGCHPSMRLTARQQQQRQQVAGSLGLLGLLDRPAARLSGGQQQRVALGRALLAAKPVLLLDEPFSALDEQTALDAQQLLLALQAEYGFSLLMVSHQVQAMLPLMDYRLDLQAGQASFSQL